LKHQIKNKVRTLQDELGLQSDAGSLNSLSESFKNFEGFNKTQNNIISSNQSYFAKRGWTGGDSNPAQVEMSSAISLFFIFLPFNALGKV
jgi:hypothetical protein